LALVVRGALAAQVMETMEQSVEHHLLDAI
jgi:hypothetical protein